MNKKAQIKLVIITFIILIGVGCFVLAQSGVDEIDPTWLNGFEDLNVKEKISDRGYINYLRTTNKKIKKIN